MPRLKPVTNPNARRVGYSSLVWNKAASRYIAPKGAGGGRFLSPATIRATIDGDIEACGARMQEHGERLKTAAQRFKDGLITQDDYTAAVKGFRDGMASEVKALHLGNVAAALGGFHAMDAASHGRAGNALRTQYAYLSNFAVEAAGNPDIVLGLDKSRRPFEERIDAYSAAGRGTFEKASRAEHKRAGFATQENVLEETAHHCSGANSCPAHSAMGRVSIDDARFKSPGFRKCLFKCACRVNYFKSAA